MELLKFLKWLEGAVKGGVTVKQNGGFSLGVPSTYYINHGICDHLHHWCEEQWLSEEYRQPLEKQLADLFEKWPPSRGRFRFPVPHPNEEATWEDETAAIKAESAFNTFQTFGEGAYAEKRMELLEWMIQELENA